MTIEIRSYDKGYEEDQSNLLFDFTRDWIGFFRSSAEQLKNTYSQDNFDPETRLYAFENDKLIGFVTGNINENSEGERVADIRFPIYLEGRDEVADPLYNKLIKTLKSKGITTLTTVVEENWDEFEELTQEKGFVYNKDTFIYGYHKLNALEIPDTDPNVQITEVNIERDRKNLKNIYMNTFEMSEDAAEQNIKTINQMEDNQIISHCVIYEDHKIVGRGFAYRTPNKPKRCFLGNIYVDGENEEEYFDSIIAHILNKCKEKNIDIVFKAKQGKESRPDLYEKYGLTYNHTQKQYKKEL